MLVENKLGTMITNDTSIEFQDKKMLYTIKFSYYIV